MVQPVYMLPSLSKIFESMRKLIILSALLLPFAFTLTSCKKEEEKPKYPYKPIPQELRDYAWFDVGTYWNYEDSATNQLDSIYIYKTEVKVDANFNPNVPRADFEILVAYAKSALTGFKYDFYLSKYSDLKTNAISVLYTNPTHTDSIRQSEMVRFPVLLNEYYNSVTGLFILKDTLHTYILDGKVYSNVQVYYNEVDGLMDYDSTITWVAPNYGIIKKQSLRISKTYWLKNAYIKKK